MDFKDKINEAIKEGNLDYFGNIKNYKHEIPKIATATPEPTEEDQRNNECGNWLEHGGPFGRPTFPNIDGNGNGNGNGSYSELIHEGYTVEGDARRPTLIILIDGAIKRKKKNQTLESVKDFCRDWNQRCCKPEPLSDQEFEECWNEVLNRKVQESEQNKQSYNEFFDSKSDNNELLEQYFPDLKGNVYYRINLRPARFIVAFKETNHLIEIEASLSRSWDKEGNLELERTTVHKRTFLMCIPTKIVRHINPFLDIEAEESAPKCSITFVDQKNEGHIFAHKTLSGTISSLKEHHYVLGDGADSALAAIIQGFKEMGKLQDNQNIDVEGFFIEKETGKIKTSKIDVVKEPNIADLISALNFIDEVTKYYKGRLDLLATSLVWGMVAPIIFILKSTDYYLEDLYLYGASNAFKTSDGKIVLAIDGHHDNPKYALKFTHIDTVPRFGNKISKSTFPLVIDEVDLNNTIKDRDKERLINAIKIAVDSKISRHKFESSTDTDTIPIPALSPLVLTSNFPPPTHNAGFMKRMIDRHFPESESKIATDQEAIDCKAFMRTNLGRLKALGDFRNWYIMNNQESILDQKRPPPLELGFEILTKAYEYVDRKNPPEWFSLRLPQNQLEDSTKENVELVKRILIKHIDEKYDKAIFLWKVTRGSFTTFKQPTYRLKELAEHGQIRGIVVKNGKDGEFNVIISRTFLEDLYDKGVTKNQCPNLRALSDQMGGEYKKHVGNKVIEVEYKTLFDYFGDFDNFENIEEEQEQTEPPDGYFEGTGW